VTKWFDGPADLPYRRGADDTAVMLQLIAYIDPGTGSLLLQAIAGGLAASAVFAKLYWRRLLRFLRIRKPEDERQPG
jgi:hypothetical protein